MKTTYVIWTIGVASFLAGACDSAPNDGNSKALLGTGGSSPLNHAAGGTGATSEPQAPQSIQPKADFLVAAATPHLSAPALARSGSVLGMAYMDGATLHVSVSPRGDFEGLTPSSTAVATVESLRSLRLFGSSAGFFLTWVELVSGKPRYHVAPFSSDGSMSHAPVELSEAAEQDCSYVSNGQQLLLLCQSQTQNEHSARLCDINGCKTKALLPACESLYGIAPVARADHFEIVFACGSTSNTTETLKRVRMATDGSGISEPQILIQEMADSVPNLVAPGLTPGLADNGSQLLVTLGHPLVLTAFADDGQQVLSPITLISQSGTSTIATITKSTAGWLVSETTDLGVTLDVGEIYETTTVSVDISNANAVTPVPFGLGPGVVSGNSGLPDLAAWGISGEANTSTIGFAPLDSLFGAPNTLVPTSLMAPLQATYALGQYCNSSQCWIFGREMTSPLQQPAKLQYSWWGVDRSSGAVTRSNLTTHSIVAEGPFSPVTAQGIVFGLVSDPTELIGAKLGESGASIPMRSNSLQAQAIFQEPAGPRLFGSSAITGNEMTFNLANGSSTLDFDLPVMFNTLIAECVGRYVWTQRALGASTAVPEELTVFDPTASPALSTFTQPVDAQIFRVFCNDSVIAASRYTAEGYRLVVWDYSGNMVTEYGEPNAFGFTAGSVGVWSTAEKVYILDANPNSNQSGVLRTIDRTGSLTMQLLALPPDSQGLFLSNSTMKSLEVADGELRYAGNAGNGDVRLVIWPVQ